MASQTILVVEDEEILAAVMRKFLISNGYEVVATVSTGEEAIYTAITRQPDLVLMDINLKGNINGIQAFSIIRDVADIPVVFASTFADERVISKMTKHVPSGYLLKPFLLDELLHTVQSVLNNRRHKKLDSKLAHGCMI